MIETSSLAPLFAPRSVAIIGASSDPNKIGGRPLAFLKQGGYRGAIYPINPGAKEVQGLSAYASLAEVGEPIDQVIVALPAQHVADAIDACALKGVRAVQVFAAGFGETNEAGRGLQGAIAARAKTANMRLLGPNSLGLFNVQLGFFGTFATALDGAWPAAGNIGFATQSGAFGSYAYALAQQRGLGFSKFVATGNEADVDVAECVAFLAEDDATCVIVATVEGAKDGRKLIAALELARRHRKPVIVMKAGSSAAGAAAAATHTGSLAGADAVYDSVFRQYNAYRAKSLDELVDVAYVASKGLFPASRKLGVVTTSGGIGVLIADAASSRGVELPELTEAGAARVKSLLPFAGASNPLDTSAALINDLSLYAQALEVLLDEAKADTVLGYLAHVGRNPRHFAQLKTPLYALRRRHPEQLFVLCLLCPLEVRDELEREEFVVFEEPARAVAAIAAMATIGEGFEETSNSAQPCAQPISLPARPLNESEAKAVLRQAGIEVLPERVVHSGEDAAHTADELGFPVAMKIVSADIAHKSDIGGVRLNVASSDEAARAYDEIVGNVGRAAPNAKLDGVLVTPMLKGGVETILGVVRDPVFGPVVMFGLGGVFVEVLKDVAFRAAPFDVNTAREMIEETLAAKFLKGVRGAPPGDITGLAETLAKLSRFAAANAEVIAGIDVNPYIVRERGGIALDALVVAR